MVQCIKALKNVHSKEEISHLVWSAGFITLHIIYMLLFKNEPVKVQKGSTQKQK